MATLVKVESFDENRFLYASTLQKVESLDENRFLYTSSLQKVESLDEDIFAYSSTLQKVETMDERPTSELPLPGFARTAELYRLRRKLVYY